MSNIEFRPCQPHDYKQAVPLMLMSGPDAFDYVFKNKSHTATDFLQFAFQRKGGEFSYDNHIGVWLDGQMAGIGSVFSGKKSSGFMLADFINIVTFYKWNAPRIVLCGLRIEQKIKPPVKGEVCIGHIAISEKMRNQGLGKKLLLHLMNLAKDEGQRFVLDVSVENPKAQILYERLGFTVASVVRSSLRHQYGFVVDHHRMEKMVAHLQQ